MSSSARRPLKTYARRRARRAAAADAVASVSQSSPIRALSPDREHVPFAVMATRMNKRARLVSRSAAGDDESAIDEDPADKGEGDRPLKKPRALRIESDDDGEQEGDYMRSVQRRTGFQVFTPQGSVPSDHSMAPSSGTRGPSLPHRLSPVPVARRLLTRTTSRNFKENAARHSGRSLASPFSSRPGSRASSPDKTSRKRPGHAKSRTLSQSGALREKVVDINVFGTHAGSKTRYPADAGPFEEAAVPKTAVTAHNRSSSTPALKPVVDSISSQAWFVPPDSGALSRPPPPIDLMEDDNQEMTEEHASFFQHAPLQTSTPPRRQRSATVGAWAHGLMPQLDADPPAPVHSFRYDSDVDMSDSSLPGSPTASIHGRVQPRRRRRRTIVHLSSDSLFSSSLDFSGFMSETERFPRAPASEGSRSPGHSPPPSGINLAAAFSLNNSPIDSSIRKSEDSGLKPVASTTRLTPTFFPSRPRGSLSSPSVIEHRPDADRDELLDLFSILGLDGECALSAAPTQSFNAAAEDEKWNTFDDADDSGVAFPIGRSESQISNITSSSEQIARNRRKRGDTIRASDYAKQPFSGSSGSFDSASSAGTSSAPRPAARRTRSGTITQANNTSGSLGGKRKHEGWPTIKMRTNAEALCADESEDELLLKDGDVIE